MDAMIQLTGYLISGLISLAVASVQHNKTVALMEYRLEQLEAKQDKHNNLMERMFKLEQKVEDLDLE